MRTIKLRLILQATEDKEAKWSRIRHIVRDTYKAANYIATGQYINDAFMDTVRARLKIDHKDKESISQVEEKIFSKGGFFGVKRQATTERDIKAKFPELPPCVTNPLNNNVVSNYNKEKAKLLKGDKSLRSYRIGMPVPVAKKRIKFRSDKSGHVVLWSLSREEKISFNIFYGKDKANNRATVDRIMNNDSYDYCAPSIQYKDKKLFLLLPVKEPKKENKFDPNKCVGVDLGLAIPAYVAINSGEERLAIGSSEDFLKCRLQMQSRKRQIQRSLTRAHSGHGKKRKLKALYNIREKEKQFSKNYNHNISKKVVDFSIKNNAGIIKMEFLEGISSDDKNSFILRNWSYYELQEMIKYKAKIAGIEVASVDPYYTSQICSKCGNFDKGQRKNQKDFECRKCGYKTNADYNAAVNIANSKRIVTKKEECELYKNNKRQGSLPNGEGVVFSKEKTTGATH